MFISVENKRINTDRIVEMLYNAERGEIEIRLQGHVEVFEKVSQEDWDAFVKEFDKNVGVVKFSLKSGGHPGPILNGSPNHASLQNESRFHPESNHGTNRY